MKYLIYRYVKEGDRVSSTMVFEIGMRLEAGNSPLFNLESRLSNSSCDSERGEEYLLILFVCLCVGRVNWEHKNHTLC